MPAQDPNERYVRIAMLVMLSLAMLAGVCATAIHWLGQVHHPMDMIVPPLGYAGSGKFSIGRLPTAPLM